VKAEMEAHWNYLLAIEHDLETLSRYIEFDETNFECFSVEIARLLLTSGSEVDVVCKQLCRKLNPLSKAENVHEYRNEIKSKYPNIHDFDVLLPRYGLKLKPWYDWKTPTGVPSWWTGYNKVKHHRDSDYHRANLRNAIYSVAGLFVVTLFFYKEKAELGELLPSPSLLRVTEKHFRGITHGRYDLCFVYSLRI
jgi:hypothetical protein